MSAHKANGREYASGGGLVEVGGLTPQLNAVVEGRAGGVGCISQQRALQVDRYVEACWRDCVQRLSVTQTRYVCYALPWVP